jgi:hypothetical protein
VNNIQLITYFVQCFKELVVGDFEEPLGHVIVRAPDDGTVVAQELA